MNEHLKKHIDEIKNDPSGFLKFLKLQFPLFHNSNLFFRDLQYGLEKFMRHKDTDLVYSESEEMARELSTYFEKEGVFVKIKDGAWKINYPQFVTQVPGDPFQ
jgi:hypothetical protein